MDIYIYSHLAYSYGIQAGLKALFLTSLHLHVQKCGQIYPNPNPSILKPNS
jgi:hypothetical protein